MAKRKMIHTDLSAEVASPAVDEPPPRTAPAEFTAVNEILRAYQEQQRDHAALLRRHDKLRRELAELQVAHRTELTTAKARLGKARAAIRDLRALLQRHNRVALTVWFSLEVKAGTIMALSGAGDLAWWSSLGEAVGLLAAGGYVAAPWLRALAKGAHPVPEPDLGDEE